jgi:predicted nuclease of predicted toxin-antitoxin system
MKFIIDVQLPPSLKEIFHEINIESIHTLELPHQNDITDTEIRNYCKANSAILFTKDQDFYYTHIVNQNPEKLILVKIENCSKLELKNIFRKNIQAIIELIQKENFIIINKN